MSKKSNKGRGRPVSKSAATAGGTAPGAGVPAAAKPASTASGPSPAAASPVPPPTHEAIARLAHDIWQEQGRPQGRDIDIWCEAERRLTRKP